MLRTVLLTGLALLAAAAPAAASTAAAQDGTLTVTGASGERNLIGVGVVGAEVEVRDRGATLTAGTGCTASGRVVRCPVDGLRELIVDLGDGNDRIAVGRTLTLRGRLRGGAGNDLLAGGGGPDELDGGAGRDVVTYAARPDAVAVTLAGGADDGAPGEGDDVTAVEQVNGGAGDDVLVGTGAADRLEGRGGDDRLEGGGANDVLVGGAHADLLAGGPGNDVFGMSIAADGSDALQGGAGFDRADYSARRRGVVVDADGRDDDGERPGGALSATGPLPAIATLPSPERDNVLPDVEWLRGGAGDDVLAATATGGGVAGRGGTDVLFGGPAADRLFGEAGFDRLVARDGRRDELACGTERDRVFVDPADVRAADCEEISRSFAVALAPRARTLTGDGRLRVRVACPAQAATRCVGAVRARTVRRVRRASGRRRVLTLGAARFNAPAGASIDVAIPVGAEARRALRRLGGRTRVRLSARGRDEAGAARPVATRLVLRG